MPSTSTSGPHHAMRTWCAMSSSAGSSSSDARSTASTPASSRPSPVARTASGVADMHVPYRAFGGSSTPPGGSRVGSAEWLERDATAVWHPFTQQSLWLGDEPTVVDRAEGPWLFDVDGRRYLDGVSSLWVTTFGHREPAIDAAIVAQLGRLDHATFLGTTHVPGIELAE